MQTQTELHLGLVSSKYARNARSRSHHCRMSLLLTRSTSFTDSGSSSAYLNDERKQLVLVAAHVVSSLLPQVCVVMGTVRITIAVHLQLILYCSVHAVTIRLQHNNKLSLRPHFTVAVWASVLMTHATPYAD